MPILECSPLHLWGSELRAWRDRRGLSLAELGARIFYNASHLGKFERGERIPPRHVAEACDRVLDADGHLLRLWLQIDQNADPARHAHGDEAKFNEDEAKSADEVAVPYEGASSSDGEDCVIMPCRTRDGRIIWVSLPRRTLLLSGLGAAAIAALGPLGQTPAGQRAVRLPRTTDLHPVEHFRQLMAVLVDSDNLLGPRHVIPTVREQIRVIGQVRDNHAGSDRDALLHVQAEYAEFASWLHHDAADFASARYWTDRSLELAHAAGDHDMATYILARKSQLAGDMADGRSAIDFGDAARRTAPRRTRVEAIGATYAAHGYALRGDKAACLRSLDTAAAVVSQLGNQQANPWLNPAYVEAHRGRCLSLLGDHKQALIAFDAAIEEPTDGFHRDHGVYRARQALAYAGARQLEQAASVGLSALAVATDTGSGRIMTELVHLDTLLSKTSGPSEAAEFHEALAASGMIGQQTDGPMLN